MSKEAMKLALEALEGALSDDKPYIEKSKQAVTALREALAEQPVVKQDLTPEQPAQQDSTCNKTLREQGKTYPRTCKKCGLGPCIADRVQPAQQQEPVACLVETEQGVMVWPIADINEAGTYCEESEFPILLYTSPPAQRPWAGLTDEEVKECFESVPTQDCQNYEHWRSLCARNIEAKLKEKNT